MIFLKILGIVLAVITILILLILSIRIRLNLVFSTENESKLLVKVLFFTFSNKKEEKKEDNKKKEKKESAFLKWFKRKLGIDVLTDSESLKQNANEKGISGTVNKITTVVSLLAGQIGWLLRKFRIHRLHILAICAGDDAADAAMDYGLVCAAIYPLVGYLETNLKTDKNAQDIQIGCDFEGNAKFDLDVYVSIRIIHILRALFKSAVMNAELASEEAKI